MTGEELKQLEDRLWEAADKLRVDSGLKASEYATPILGLIFLRFASIRYDKVKADIEKELVAQKNSRLQREKHEIALENVDFTFLPKQNIITCFTYQNKRILPRRLNWQWNKLNCINLNY